MREGIYIKKDTETGELYTGFIIYFYKEMRIKLFTSCSMPGIIEFAKPYILSDLAGFQLAGPSVDTIPVYRLEQEDITIPALSGWDSTHPDEKINNNNNGE